MFIGHFGVGMAAKKIAPEANLGLLFFACQLLDLIWPILVLLNFEHVSAEPGATVVTPLNFSHYPYSHSLFSTSLYGLIAGLVSWRFFKSRRVALVIGMVVLSHWVLDLITHRPDLPIAFGEAKYGFGLWNSLWGTLIVEVGLFVFGIAMFLKSVPPQSSKRKFTFWAMILFLSVIYSANVFGPKAPESTPPAMIAGPALAMWLLVIWAYFSDSISSKSAAVG